MGFSFSWIAVQGLTREQVLNALGMEVSGVNTDYLEGIVLFDRPEGWLIVVSEDDRDAMEGSLSDLGPLAKIAVARGFNEDKGYNVASGYAAGEALWSITVNPSRRVFSVVGQPPAQLDAIISTAKAEQGNTETDLFFDIPAVLAESICGFRLGKSEPNASPHVNLKSTGAKPATSVRNRQKPGFFARLFGRG